jgi:hypothetical protein
LGGGTRDWQHEAGYGQAVLRRTHHEPCGSEEDCRGSSQALGCGEAGGEKQIVNRRRIAMIIPRCATLKVTWIVLILGLSLGVSSRETVGIALEADAQWHLDFPDLPDTLATMSTGQRQPARLTVRLPGNYSRNRKFPLSAFLNGNDGGRGDTLPRDPQTIGSNDFICVSLPLFKQALNKTDGVLVTVDDFEIVSRAYRAMFQKLVDTVPNIDPERSALGGFSNGAHTTALLLAGQDDFILSHFHAFYFVEGGNPLAANALHRAALKPCRFLLMCGDQGSDYLSPAVEARAKECGLGFTFVTMRSTGHEFPLKYQRLMGQWIRGERLSETEQK